MGGYGRGNWIDGRNVPRDYARHVWSVFECRAAQEFSIVDASSDWEPGQGDIECNSNDGQNRTQFLPTFPASCEGVTPIRST
jgi:tripeptidyl-peptidase-1